MKQLTPAVGNGFFDYMYIKSAIVLAAGANIIMSSTSSITNLVSLFVETLVVGITGLTVNGPVNILNKVTFTSNVNTISNETNFGGLLKAQGAFQHSGPSAASFGAAGISTTGNILASNATFSGAIIGTVQCSTVNTTGDITVGGQLNFQQTSGISVGSGGIATSGSINATGNCSANMITASYSAAVGSGGLYLDGPLVMNATSGFSVGVGGLTTTGNVNSAGEFYRFLNGAPMTQLAYLGRTFKTGGVLGSGVIAGEYKTIYQYYLTNYQSVGTFMVNASVYVSSSDTNARKIYLQLTEPLAVSDNFNLDAGRINVREAGSVQSYSVTGVFTYGTGNAPQTCAVSLRIYTDVGIGLNNLNYGFTITRIG